MLTQLIRHLGSRRLVTETTRDGLFDHSPTMTWVTYVVTGGSQADILTTWLDHSSSLIG